MPHLRISNAGNLSRTQKAVCGHRGCIINISLGVGQKGVKTNLPYRLPAIGSKVTHPTPFVNKIKIVIGRRIERHSDVGRTHILAGLRIVSGHKDIISSYALRSFCRKVECGPIRKQIRHISLCKSAVDSLQRTRFFPAISRTIGRLQAQSTTGSGERTDSSGFQRIDISTHSELYAPRRITSKQRSGRHQSSGIRRKA